MQSAVAPFAYVTCGVAPRTLQHASWLANVFSCHISADLCGSFAFCADLRGSFAFCADLGGSLAFLRIVADSSSLPPS